MIVPSAKVGDRFEGVELPHSEVCMHMRVAGKVATIEVVGDRWPMAQIILDGKPFSFPVTLGEAGIIVRP